jgi:aspartate/methionine/tyrosine aminotransferase
MLSSLVRGIGFSPTLAVSDLARRMRADGVDVLDFAAGQPDFPTPDVVKAAGKRAIDENKTGYTATPGVPELRAAIAERIEADRGLAYAPEEIVVSPGAKASLYFACRALLDPGDEVVIPTPYWTSYPEIVRMSGGVPLFVACREENGFRLTADDMRKAITPRTKAMILNTPSNPTGACYGRDDLAPLANLCVERGVWVISDEIYSKLIYDGAEFAGIAQLGDEIRARTVLIDGVSKTYSMTGWRIGYAAGPEEVVSGMAKLQSHSTSNATSISQWASIAALAMSDDELRPRVDEFKRRRDEMIRGLREMSGWSCSVPEGAFYLFPNVSGCFEDRGAARSVRSGQEMATYLLEEAGVAIVPGEAFGSENHIRLSYAVSIERVREGLDRIAGAMRKLAG